MNDEVIKRPEFTLFQKTMEDALLSIKDSMKAIAVSSEKHSQEAAEQNRILREYIITNELKHEKTDDRLTGMERGLTKMEEVVAATKNVSDFWEFVWRWARYILVGALAAGGGILANNYFDINIEEKPSVKIEQSKSFN